MKILVSNDDGYQANGVHRLCEWLKAFGEVIAVCPDGPRSGQSMAITVNEPLRLTPVPSEDGIEWYKVNGTPVDCVKLAMHTLFKNEKPGLVVAGINHGSNAAINVVYSGTMGATFEGCAQEIPSIGFSLTDHSADANFEPCKPFVEKIVKKVIEHSLPSGVCLNVNIPTTDRELSGMKIVRGARGHWSDEYERFTDPHGRDFYWLTGRFVNEEPDAEDTDEWCLAHGIVSIVPTLLDRTAPGDFSL